jgi:hypothetical protein
LLLAPLALGAPTPGPRPPPALDPWSTALAAEAAPKPSSSVAAEVAAPHMMILAAHEAEREAVRRHAATRARHMAQLRLGAHSLLADVSGLEHDF